MKIIGENLHIISNSVKEAIKNKDNNFIQDLITRQAKSGICAIDLNIGPAKKNMEGTMEWLVKISEENTNIPLCLDSSNIEEIKSGLKIAKGNTENFIINSTSADSERLDILTDITAEYNCNLIALTMNKEIGIPKKADERLELAFEILEVANSKGIPNEKIIFDPLILPILVAQDQAIEALNSIRMFKESFDPQVKTIVGLSNLSNGCPSHLRSIINRVFLTMAFGNGLDYAIADAFDTEIFKLIDIIKTQDKQTSTNKTILELYQAQKDMLDLCSVNLPDEKDCQTIIKCAKMINNEIVYSHRALEL